MNPPTASLHRWEERADAFRRSSEDYQEDVKARAKIRHVVVLSHDIYCQRSDFKSVSVVPAYTVKPHRPDVLEAIRRNLLPHLHYLGEDPEFPEWKECFLDFRHIHPLDKRFLDNDKLEYALAPIAVKAVIERLKEYLSLETAV